MNTKFRKWEGRNKSPHKPLSHTHVFGEVSRSSQGRLVPEATTEPWLRGLIALAYTLGFRKSELLEMRCSQADLLNNTVSLYTRNGAPVKDFRGTWDLLTKLRDCLGSCSMAFARSAVRNMICRGVPQKTAREISGHKTDAVFSRYNIVSEADIRDAARKIEQGAKAVILSSFIVAPDQGSERATENEVKPRKSIS